MKKISLFIITLLIFATNSYAQKIEFKNSQNGITLIRTTPYSLDFKDEIELRIDHFTTGDSEEYYLYLRMEANKPHNFSSKSKLLLKCVDGSVVELTSIFTTIDESNTSLSPAAWFPIKEDQLKALFNGISKIRVDLLSVNEKEQSIFSDLQDKEYKKDKVGAELKGMYEVIQKEKARINKADENLIRKNASDNF